MKRQFSYKISHNRQHLQAHRLKSGPTAGVSVGFIGFLFRTDSVRIHGISYICDMKKIRDFFCVAAMALLAMACVTDKDEPVWSVGVGERCPDFSVTLSGGETVATVDLSGQTTLILFFDTACEDCRAILPVVQELYTEICDDESGAGRGKHVLAISRAQPAQSVSAYWAEHSLTIPVSPQSDRSVYDLFASSQIPRIYIISPDLRITHTYADTPSRHFPR